MQANPEKKRRIDDTMAIANAGLGKNSFETSKSLGYLARPFVIRKEAATEKAVKESGWYGATCSVQKYVPADRVDFLVKLLETAYGVATTGDPAVFESGEISWQLINMINAKRTLDQERVEEMAKRAQLLSTRQAEKKRIESSRRKYRGPDIDITNYRNHGNKNIV